MSRWKWQVTCRYNDTVKWPKAPGEIAIQTVHADDSSKDMEVQASECRGDVDVEVVRLSNSPSTSSADGYQKESQ
jgi:hypothetical protein